MNYHGKDDLQLVVDDGKGILDATNFIIQSEESATIVKMEKNDENTCLESEHSGRGTTSHVEYYHDSVKEGATRSCSLYPSIGDFEESGSAYLCEKEGHLNSEAQVVDFYNMPNPSETGDKLHQSTGELNMEGKISVPKNISTDIESHSSAVTKEEKDLSLLNPQICNMRTSKTMLPEKKIEDINQNGDSCGTDSKEKYFYYETPLFEDTGFWIPVSVPPMSEKEREEWTKGLCSNGGYIPEGDMGWGDCIREDKDLTMWDVVMEMLLVARGKVSSLASGDVGNLTWISTHLIEQAWNEMAQTLTEVTLSNTQEILQSDPPKWLPDSTSSSCMLCGVRFHPIMCTRHHCRFCGGIFCSECSKGRSLLPEKFRTSDPQRVCDVCCVRLESVQPYLMERVSCAAQLPTHDLTDLSTLRSWVNFPWGQSMEYEIYKATNTIQGYSKVGSMRPERKIPETILQNAKGLAILTVVKVGMVVTYNIGTGLVVARREDGSWSPPSAISSFGVGWGAQAGGELTDFVIVLRTNDAVKTFCGDTHISIGAGVSAAMGVIGRTAGADMRAGASGSTACYTYSSSKGAFIGCSLEGSVVTTRAQANSRFYGSHSITASGILLGTLPQPPAAATLYRALDDLYAHLER